MQTKLIVGLGNPGEKYKNTRHNVGFEVLDRLINDLDPNGIESKENLSKKLQSKVVSINSVGLVLIYPQTYMNLSGKAVRAALDWYKIKDLKQLLIVHDDVSLPLGKIRWVVNGGAGGQHGIESTIQHLSGRKDFQRLKFGIGPDPGGDRRSKYVLERFPSKEQDLLDKSLLLATKSIKSFVDGKSVEEIMNEYNGLEAQL